MILGLRGIGALPAGVPSTGATNGYVNLGGAGTGTMAAPVAYDVWTDVNGNVVAVFTNGAWAPISIQGDSLSQYEQVLAAASVAYNSGAVSIAPSSSTSTTSTTSTTVTTPTFSTGLELWGTPSSAFSALTSMNWSTAFFNERKLSFPCWPAAASSYCRGHFDLRDERK
jgi:hypothetical protein